MGKYWGSFKWLRIATIGAFMALAACTKIDHITVAMPHIDSISTLDPSQLGLASQYVLMDNLALKLVHINASNDYEMVLAESIEQSTDKLTYKITIKEAHFSDGSLITSDDVARSIRRLALYGSSHIPIQGFLKGSQRITSIDEEIPGIKIINPRKLEIHLSHHVKEFIYYLSLADAGIVHKEIASKRNLTPKDWSITSGAYRIEKDRLVANKKSLLHREDMPQEVRFDSPPLVGSQQDLAKFDIGYSSFLDKSRAENITLKTPFKYTSSSFQYLLYLVLNPKSDLFKDIRKRREIARRIHLSLQNTTQSPFFQKASQFFLPDSFAFQKTFSPLEVLPPKKNADQASNFTIFATLGTMKYAPSSLAQDLSSILENETVISYKDTIDDYKTRQEKRNFDAYLVPTSMSYNVVTESLNLLYHAKTRFADNPNGKIIKLIDEYQRSQTTSPETIESIIKEMTLEAEVIPLFYVSAPKFYNSDRLDISEMNTAESLTFWKLRVK